MGREKEVVREREEGRKGGGREERQRGREGEGLRKLQISECI